MITISTEALGTHRKIAYDSGATLDDSILDIIQNFEGRYSRFLSGSLISTLNKEKKIEADEELLELVKIGYEAYVDTNGIFSPFIGSSLVNLGYDENYSFESTNINEIPESIFSIQGSTILLGPKTVFDVGGYGKGYLIDKIANYFKKKSLPNWIINGGGDIRFHRKDDKYKKTLGIPHIQDPSLLIAERNASSGAIASSSSLVRNRGAHHHLINAETGTSVSNNMLSTTVFDQTACSADIGATTLFVGGEQKLESASKLLGVKYLALLDNNTVMYSKNIDNVTVFTQ